MIIGIGTDIIQIKRIELIIKRFNGSFISRIFTLTEQDKAQDLSPKQRANFYAKRYAAKEAISKALGTGIGLQARWQEIEILNLPNGSPFVTLYGYTAHTLVQKANGHPTRIHLSLSDDLNAVAFVVIETLD